MSNQQMMKSLLSPATAEDNWHGRNERVEGTAVSPWLFSAGSGTGPVLGGVAA